MPGDAHGADASGFEILNQAGATHSILAVQQPGQLKARNSLASSLPGELTILENIGTAVN